MSTIQWAFLLLEIVLIGITIHFYAQAKRATGIAVANLEAWRAEVELHLDTLIQELEIVLNEAPPPISEERLAQEANGPRLGLERLAANITDTVEIATSGNEPIPPTPARVEEETATVEARYEEARQLHAQGLDETTIARRTGLEREEVRLLFALTPVSPIAQAAPSMGNGGASEKVAVASINRNDALAPYMSNLLD